MPTSRQRTHFVVERGADHAADDAPGRRPVATELLTAANFNSAPPGIAGGATGSLRSLGDANGRHSQFSCGASAAATEDPYLAGLRCLRQRR